MSVDVFDDRPCLLGEGPLWHPQRNQLFWFDILGNRMLSNDKGMALEWDFDGHVSAAGWIDRSSLLIAGEKELFTFDIDSSRSEHVCDLENDTDLTRSNDGRADPWGGFWIGTMGKHTEIAAGAIYRYFKGELRRLYASVTIPKSICFSPDSLFAYFADTVTHQIWRQPLADKDGWPVNDPSLFIDLAEEGLDPDGSIVDAEGCLWNAQWGASRVARYSKDGRFLSAIPFPKTQISCPAFGGDHLDVLFATSAAKVFATSIHESSDHAGKTFRTVTTHRGLPEYQVRL